MISALLLFSYKIFSKVFYKTEAKWIHATEDNPWKDMRLFVFLHHTSLFEPLFFSALPWSLLWRAARHSIVPGADKTLNRPIIGTFFRLLGPRMVSITRKRDHTWRDFLQQIKVNSLIVILPEGRMKRADGLDSEGKPMSIRGGIVDILRMLPEGKMVLAYSGGLHHVQVPGQGLPRLFKTIRINFEKVDVAHYKSQFPSDPEEFRAAIIADLAARMKAHCPPEEKPR